MKARDTKPTRVESAVDEEWSSLVDRLFAHIEEIVADFLKLFAEADYYEPRMVDKSDLTRTAHDTLTMLLHKLGDKPLPQELKSLSHEFGARRARQGVPEDVLLEAIRLDFRVLWYSLQRHAGPDSDALLVRNVERVLTTVEDYVSEVQQSFLAEQARLSRDSRLLTARHVSRLFTSDLTRPELVAEIADGLGVSAAAQFEIVLVVGEGVAELQLQLARGTISSSWFGYDRGDGFCMFREQGTPTASTSVAEELANLPGGYIDEVIGLANVPAAADAAALFARQASRSSHPRMLGTNEAWLAVARDLLASAIPDFGRDVREALAECTQYERDHLVHAVLAYSETGSIKLTSERLFCHRNTVVNRLSTFRQVTGLDITVPRDAAIALVVLHSP
ncbi:helix-turn-helix domain-containing protein [Salinibacterium sp. NSLL150]|uniref:helix-turn-helix domain-containing protein n=1 Tax=unclassified Salinibacterium TaxID=2632331 RepID=UPI0018CD640D|nr:MULTISPECIES: helix-turn-helix domain-containing protein [unclassified Salinibacterium]MBH0097716.1 helix-turn-helix domain-containing protein [Salinibacterium sp. NSLL35]MBH0100471.1 helix-turn-helix domain-containing protein [Salinibacterium sp. NSLL150]MBH0103230.1 helix-turn-helix domain-containing protein [Salinibacterium sp. NSLL16]MBH0105991.1 helix-turn-helix domain-containing protein [Salinibacterium sp. NSLL17]